MSRTRRGGADVLDLIGSSPSVSAPNTGRLRYDTATQKFQSSENGGAFVDIGSGGGGGGGVESSGASIYHSTTQASTSAVWLLMTYDSEIYDTANYHSAGLNPSRMTASVTGYYFVMGSAAWAANQTGGRHLTICKNAAGVVGVNTQLYASYQAHPTHPTQAQVSGVVYLVAGEYLELFAYQDSGSGLAITKGISNPFQMQLINAAGVGSAFSGVSVYNSVSTSVPHNVLTLLTHDTELYDTAGYHHTSINAGRLTAPVAGYYIVHGGVSWDASTAGTRMLEVRKNAAGNPVGGTGVAIQNQLPASVGFGTIHTSSTVLYLLAGEYVELFAYQSSGGALNAGTGVSLPFSMTLIQGSVVGDGLFGASMSAAPTAASTGFDTWWYQWTGSTYTDGEQGPLIVTPTTAGLNRWTARSKVAPTPPYTIDLLTAGHFPLTPNAAGLVFVGWSEAATGAANKADVVSIFPDQFVQPYHDTLTNAVSAPAGHVTIVGTSYTWDHLQWWRLTDNGTTAVISWSATGDPGSFLPILTTTKAGSFLGAAGYNYILFGILASGSSGTIQLLSYKQT